MGLFDRLKTKKERLYKDPETGETSWVPVEREKKYAEMQGNGDSVRVRREEIPLTREEQFPAKRQQPWQTDRGKHIIKGVGSGVKRLDKAVVNYNRTRNIMYRQPTQKMSNYSTQNNANPFGNMFDTGFDKPSSRPSKKKSKTKYKVIGGKAYPIAGTGKRKKKTSRRKQSSKSRDPFNAFGGYKL